MTAFKYSPLNCPQSIRLILLKPSRFRDTPLQCHLMSFKLSALPRYEALSYTWEGQRPCWPISCNGSELLVTPNVEAALKQLRPRHFQRHLWIDAICIDQNNLKERSSQVCLMEQIYQNAVRVVVWLGVGNEMTARAFRTLKWVFPLYKLILHVPFARYVSLRHFQKMKANFQDVLLRADDSTKWTGGRIRQTWLDDSLQGLRGIVHHNWFRRIWTMQEISLPARAVVQCGGSKIRWAALSNALTFDGVLMNPKIPTPVLMEGGYNPAVPIYNEVPFMGRMQQIQSLREWTRRSRQTKSWPMKYFPTQHHPPLPFIVNLLLTGLNPAYMATDPKDRVFGILGVLRALDIELLVPDYQKTFSDLVPEAFTAVAVKHKSLELLHFVRGQSSFGDLPSWIPDFWTVPWCANTAGLEHSNEAKWELSDSDFTITGRNIQL
jgi:hypothetical protein